MPLLILVLLIVISLSMAALLAVMQSVFIWMDPETIQDIQQRQGNKWLKKMIVNTDRVIAALGFGRDVMTYMAVILFTIGVMRDVTAIKLIMHILIVSIAITLLVRALPQRIVYVRSVRWALALQGWMYAAYMFFLLPSLVVSWFANQIGFTVKKHFIRIPDLFDSSMYVNIVRRGDRAVAQDDDGRTAHLLQTHIAQLSKQTVQSIMQPIEYVPRVDGSLPTEEVVDFIVNASAPRILLYNETPDNVIGIIHVGLLAKALCDVEGDRNGIDIVSVASEPLYTKAGTMIIEQIQIFHRCRNQFALVVDASNRIVGAVSMDMIHANMMQALS